MLYYVVRIMVLNSSSEVSYGPPRRDLFRGRPSGRGDPKRVSSPGEFHPKALVEPDVTLSSHPAPIIQPGT